MRNPRKCAAANRANRISRRYAGKADRCVFGFGFRPADNFVELLQELIDLFYASRNEIPDAVSDDELIEYMKRAFNGTCAGSIELLAGRELPTLYRRLRAGETIAQSMEKLS